MNITMKNAVFIDQRGKMHPFDEFSITSRNVKFIHIPKDVSFHCISVTILYLVNKLSRKLSFNAIHEWQQCIVTICVCVCVTLSCFPPLPRSLCSIRRACMCVCGAFELLDTLRHICMYVVYSTHWLDVKSSNQHFNYIVRKHWKVPKREHVIRPNTHATIQQKSTIRKIEFN